MRSIMWIAALGLVALPAMAGTGATGAGGNSSAANTATAPATTAAAQPASAPAASSKAAPAAAPAAPSTENELQQLRDLIEAQAKQLQEQNDQLREQQQQMQELEDQVRASSTPTNAENLAAAPVAISAPAIGVPAFGVGTTETPDPAGSTRSVSLNPGVSGYGGMDNPEQPTSIHYKGVTLTPGGFMAAETVWRQKALGADINTPFNSLPFDGASNSHLTEFFGSGRQSRISMLVEGKLDNVKIGGYYEMDFLSAGTTSNNNQSNSYTMRQRQFWAQAAFNNGFTITGGQQWSLLTETTHGMDNRTEALPMNIDAQYNVGFSWARQYGFRVTKNFGNKFWLGFSVENSQATVTVHGNPTVTSGGTQVVTCTVITVGVCTTTATTVVNATTTNDFLLGQYGAGGGLYNPAANYSYNPSPDFIVKAVFEPGFGHYEIFGIGSEERDRVFPCAALGGSVAPIATGTTTVPPAGCTAVNSAQFANNTSAGIGGGGVNARWSLFAKKVDFGLHFFGGTGIGRYGSVGLADATVRPNGSIVPLHNYQSLVTLQFHPTKKLDIYLYGGDEYEGRATYVNAAGKADGYGGFPLFGAAYTFNNSGCWIETQPIVAPSTSNSLGVPTGLGGSTGFIPGALANCTGDTRNVVEGTLGFWYRFYSGPKGRVQMGMQYSNVYRDTWSGTKTGGGPGASGQPHSDENMAFTSFRYYLP